MQLISANSPATSTLFGLHLIWGNAQPGLEIGIAGWLVVMLARHRL